MLRNNTCNAYTQTPCYVRVCEDERHANPILRTLIEVYLEPASEFDRTCFGGAFFTNRIRTNRIRLLDAVSTYLTDPFEMQYLRRRNLKRGKRNAAAASASPGYVVADDGNVSQIAAHVLG